MINLEFELKYFNSHMAKEQIDLLEKIDTSTEEDRFNFSKKDWCDYAKGYYQKILLPQITEPVYFSNRVNDPVIPLAGRKFKVKVTSDDLNEVYEPNGKYLILEETEEDLTVPDCVLPNGFRRGHYWKFFGQPTWIQGELFPLGESGNPCVNFVTIENGWGDSGNWNILVDLGSDGLPIAAYFEASCC